MNRTYEVMYIIRPDIDEASLDGLIEGFNTVVTNGGGEIQSAEKMGRRRLAYIVRKFQDGQFILLTIAADGKVVAELERRLRVTEQVIKFITVRMDEEDKRVAKIKAHRDAHVKRSALPQVNAEASAETADAPTSVAVAPAPVEVTEPIEVPESVAEAEPAVAS